MPSTIWKGQLTFGLVTIPVKLYRAARKATVRMRYVHQPAAEGDDLAEEPERGARVEESHQAALREQMRRPVQDSEERAEEGPGATIPPRPVMPVKQQLVTQADEKPVARSEVVRAYEYEPDQYVAIAPEELQALRVKKSPDMQILQCVKFSEVDPIYLETSYYVVPDRGGERPYNLLFAALSGSGFAALARAAMHGREHILIIRPGRRGLLAHTMYYSDEVRAEDEFRSDTSVVGAKELELAKAFVNALAAPFDPEQFRDTYRERLQSLISGKVDRQEFAPAVTPAPARPPAADILEALKASLAAAKKPAARASAPADKIVPIKKKARRA
jgi:DNA end-binding protein Ku